LRPALARRLQFISTQRKKKGFGVNIDNHHNPGLGQGFWILDFRSGNKQKVGRREKKEV